MINKTVGFLALLLPGVLFANVENVVARMQALQSFRADIQIDVGDNFSSGVLSYQGGKLHLALNDGRVIASNGRELQIYMPSTQVVGKQELTPGSGGLGWLLRGYTSEVSTGKARLKAEKTDAYIQEVRLKWNKSYHLQQISMLRRNNDKWLTISLSNIREMTNFPAHLFSWHAPAGSRTVENPLNQSN